MAVDFHVKVLVFDLKVKKYTTQNCVHQTEDLCVAKLFGQLCIEFELFTLDQVRFREIQMWCFKLGKKFQNVQNFLRAAHLMISELFLTLQLVIDHGIKMFSILLENALHAGWTVVPT